VALDQCGAAALLRTSAEISIGGRHVDRLRAHLVRHPSTHDYGKRVAQHLDLIPRAHQERAFEDGEHKFRPLVEVRRQYVFVVPSLSLGSRRSEQPSMVSRRGGGLSAALRAVTRYERTRQPPPQSFEAPGGAQPDNRPSGDALAFGERDLAGDAGQNEGSNCQGSSTEHSNDRSIPSRAAGSGAVSGGGQSCSTSGRSRCGLRSSRARSVSGLTGRATRSGTRRLGLGMPRGRPRRLPELPLANRPRESRSGAIEDQDHAVEIPRFGSGEQRGEGGSATVSGMGDFPVA